MGGVPCVTSMEEHSLAHVHVAVFGEKGPRSGIWRSSSKLVSISPSSLCASLLLKCDKMTGPPKFLPFLQAKESQWNKSAVIPRHPVS